MSALELKKAALPKLGCDVARTSVERLSLRDSPWFSGPASVTFRYTDGEQTRKHMTIRRIALWPQQDLIDRFRLRNLDGWIFRATTRAATEPPIAAT